MHSNHGRQRGIRKLICFVFALALVGVLYTIPVFAEGVSVTAEPAEAVVGDTVTVSYQADKPTDTAEPPQIEVAYDPNRLAFVACDKEYGGGEGGYLQLTDIEASITFTVLSGGVADINVTAIYDGNGDAPATGTASINVEGEDTAAAMGGALGSSTGVEAGTIVSSDGTKIISTVFADEYMPALFHKTTTTYEGQTVEAAAFDMGDITLLYVTDNTGENGNFNIYDPATGSLSDFKMIQGIENRYIIILKAPESVQAPNGFTKAALQWDGLTLEAYAVNAIDSTVISDVAPTDFFLLYAISSEGNEGWFLYDQLGGTYQRYLPIANEGVKSGEDEGGFLSALTGGDGEEKDFQAIALRRLIIIGVMAVVMIVMFIFLLNFFLKLRDYQSYDYIDEEEEEEDDRPIRREPSVEETSRIRASELARMEMGETFEPVDFDKLVNDPHKKEQKPGGVAPAKSVTTPAAAAAKLGTPPPPAANQASPSNSAAPTAARPAGPAPAAPAPGAPAPAAAQAAAAKPENGGTPINAASVSDFVRPASPAEAEGFKDDYEEAESGFGRKSREEKKKEKKRKKAMNFDEPEEIDWSSLEGSIKDTSDERRPKGGESPYSKLMDAQPQNTASAAAANVAAAAGATAAANAAAISTPAASAPAPAAPAAKAAPEVENANVPVVETPKVKVDLPTDIPKPDHSKAVKPASQIHKETVPQQESGYWQQSSTQQYAENAYEQDHAGATQNTGAINTGYDPYVQQQYTQPGYDPYVQQQYTQPGYDPYVQQQYTQPGYDPYVQQQYTSPPGYDPYAQQYGYQQGYDPYGQPYGYSPYGQNPAYNTQNIDLDDDFEFEFIDIKR